MVTRKRELFIIRVTQLNEEVNKQITKWGEGFLLSFILELIWGFFSVGRTNRNLYFFMVRSEPSFFLPQVTS